jgi:hypothetical protein
VHGFPFDDGEWRALNGVSGQLLGQDQLAVFGDAQAVGFPLVGNQDFLVALEQIVRREGAHWTSLPPGLNRKAEGGRGVYWAVGSRGIGWHGGVVAKMSNKKGE